MKAGITYVAPQRDLRAFTCPHCGVFAQQKQSISKGGSDFGGHLLHKGSPVTWGDPQKGIHAVGVTHCENCAEICIWFLNLLVHPRRGNAPLPNSDMPVDVMKEYEEAANICTQSPRGAAALLRLAIQKLCIHLGGEGKRIDDDIAMLVKNGLPPRIQKALDIVRVTGNDAVHPGKIDTDDIQTAESLFPLVNVIVEQMITITKELDRLYENLPPEKREYISKRDNKCKSD